MTARRFPAQLACSRCDATFAIRELMNLCPNDAAPLLVRYDIAKSPELRDEIRRWPATMWRYRELLPVDDESEIVTLGEGITPLLQSRNFDNIWIKDESKNPTRSFKSRGMAAAVTMARRLGARSLAAPTARRTARVRGHAARYAAIDRR
jgi:threonine synthase